MDKRIDSLCRHIEGVQKNTLLLGTRLIEDGDEKTGIMLIANGFIHDHSKFYGVEWEYLGKDDSEASQLAIRQHQHTNKHHPQYWGGIHDMPDLYVAEMVCDWKARSNEFGTDLREWIDNEATKTFSFTKREKIYRTIKKYLDLLLDKPFS